MVATMSATNRVAFAQGFESPSFRVFPVGNQPEQDGMHPGSPKQLPLGLVSVVSV